MLDGQFGFDLEAGAFNDLGNGVTLSFAHVDSTSHDLLRVFIKTADGTFTASRGRLGFDFAGRVLVDLRDGLVLDARNGQSLTFSAFRFESAGAGGADAGEDGENRKRMMLPELLASHSRADNAAGWARLLWPAFALMIPSLAAVLGKPRRRSNSALGLMLGSVLLVVFIRSAGLVAVTASAHPALLALATCAIWMALVGGLSLGERRLGAGYIDQALLQAFRLFPARRFVRASASH
jgi:lipopolysaccharide export LptBFGC system permease protein LptF